LKKIKKNKKNAKNLLTNAFLFVIMEEPRVKTSSPRRKEEKMKYFKIEYQVKHTNNGIAKEWSLCQALTGSHPIKHDRTAWNVGSDIESLHISVKSDRFSLTSGGQLHGQNKAEMLNDYFARVASTTFAYVTNTYEAYLMNATEFRAFLEAFTATECDSSKNGGKLKLRAYREERNDSEMLKWLNERV
jgi:hypothetical protein